MKTIERKKEEGEKSPRNFDFFSHNGLLLQFPPIFETKRIFNLGSVRWGSCAFVWTKEKEIERARRVVDLNKAILPPWSC